MGTRSQILFSIAVNGLLPWGVYELLHTHMGSTQALIYATLVPLVDNLIHFARHRKVDVFGSLMLFTFLLTLGLAFAGGGERIILMRESFISGGVGIIFLGSLVFHKPLMYYLARKFVPSERFVSNSKYPYFRYVMRLMTFVWGSGLILESLLRIYLVYRLTIDQFLAVSSLLFYIAIGLLILWTVWYRRKSARKLAAVIADSARAH
ncbi:hypothetical protein A8990_12739 [Paenibacillus taihuensis]|uniref:Intracellular septation protein A n=1 Tax=Paenibacillus taihuensis TaxID=1156355 RepID=A0A3D9RNL8_9BACL|nr:VC0807 family protein [Paenibacillus taihuensis]REE77719.1 hypothetical protein A8990_12739 [Paenibacillus taihuensis]